MYVNEKLAIISGNKNTLSSVFLNARWGFD